MRRDLEQDRQQNVSVQELVTNTLSVADGGRLTQPKKYIETQAQAIASRFDPLKGGTLEEYRMATDHVLGLASTSSKSAGMLYDALLRPEYLAPHLEVPSKEQIADLIGERRIPASYDNFNHPVYYYTPRERWNAAIIRAHMEGPAVQIARAYRGAKIPLDAIVDACQETGRRYHLIAESMMKKVVTGDTRVHLPVVIRFFEEYGERMVVRPEQLDSIDLINLSSLGGLRGLDPQDKIHVWRGLNIANIVLAGGVTSVAHRLPLKGKDLTTEFGKGYAGTRLKAFKFIQDWERHPEEEEEADGVSESIHDLLDKFNTAIADKIEKGVKSGRDILLIHDPDELFLAPFYVQELFKNVPLPSGFFIKSVLVPGPFDSEYQVAWAIARTGQEATLRALNKAQAAFHNRIRTLMQVLPNGDLVKPTGSHRSDKLSDAALGSLVAYSTSETWFVSREAAQLNEDKFRHEKLLARVEKARTSCTQKNYYLPKRGEYYDVTAESGSQLYGMGLRRIDLTNAPVRNTEGAVLFADLIFVNGNGKPTTYRVRLKPDYTHVGMEEMGEYARTYVLDHVYQALEESKLQMEKRAKRKSQHRASENGGHASETTAVENKAKAANTEEYWMTLQYGNRPDPNKLSNSHRNESALTTNHLYFKDGKPEVEEFADQFTAADAKDYSKYDVYTVLFRINRDLRRIQTREYWAQMQHTYPDLSQYDSYAEYLRIHHKNVYDRIVIWADTIMKRTGGDDIFDTDHVKSRILYSNGFQDEGIVQEVSPYYLVQYVVPEKVPTVRRKIKPKKNIFYLDESH